MEPFIVNTDITDINDLYGRAKSIKILQSCASRKENAGIIGARRFGKTCLLKSMESFINSHPEINAVPVYFDVKSQATIHKNTPEVYMNIAALLAKKMCEMNIVEEGEFKLSRRCSLDISTDLVDMKVQMSDWHAQYKQDALFALADKVNNHGKYVLLLLDEIDSLLLEALNTPSDFGRIRGAANDGTKLNFLISGTAPWKSFTYKVGSPELNCGLEQCLLSKMAKTDFDAMWYDECSKVEDESLKQKLLLIKDQVYDKTGGIPYYSKFIGSSFVNGTIDEMPDYTILRDYLCEIYDNKFMTDAERSVLKTLADKPMRFDNIADDVNALVTKGLVGKDENTYSIVLDYLVDYVKAKSLNTNIQESIDIEQKERDILVDEIARLIDVNCKKIKPSPFKPSFEDWSVFNSLKIQCTNESTLLAFATSVCKIYYEGSDLGRCLPVGYISRNFCNIIRSLRNRYDHRDCEPRILDDRRLFSILNNGIVPFQSIHFANIQSVVLNMFKQELLDMNQTGTNPTVSTRNSMAGTERAKFLEDGKEYEGLIVVVNNQHGTFFNVKCQNHAYPLQIITKLCNLRENDVVLFTAIKEQNLKDSSKFFWKADNVRKK